MFSAWPEIAGKFDSSRHIVLLADYDGTLTPIVERPELAVLPEPTRELLQRISRQRRATLGIVSGRALSDLRQKVGLTHVIYAGNHGLEIEGPGLSFIHPLAEEFKPVFRLLYQLLSRAFGGSPAVLVEHKGLTLTVHYRLVNSDREAEEVRGTFNAIVAGARALGTVKTASGKKVLEVRPPVNWHKGKAIQLILKKYARGGNHSGTLVVYLGDDLSDEDAFKFVEKANGISVFVGEETEPTAARYFLKSPAEVQEFLKRFADLARKDQ